ncbi:hypothetical protein QAD02_009680 [Eretmocerus hayati]|uniref:Uncharacterized protein n=1 Tax=Eretmocerus hayati TaxID=131215 RepID=A0ACC2NAD0_9HYME|nr:hypothetical protein QAD02_009680 [Eretmocerus hayati]
MLFWIEKGFRETVYPLHFSLKIYARSTIFPYLITLHLIVVGLPSEEIQNSLRDAPYAPFNFYPKIPRVKVVGRSACSGIFIHPRIIFTNHECIANSIHAETKVKLRQALHQGKDAVYDIISINCAVNLLVLNNSAESAEISNLSQKNDSLPQIGQYLTLTSWDTSAYVDGVQRGLLRSVNLTVEMSSMDCAKKLNITLGDGEIICAKVTSRIKLPKKIVGGPLTDSNGTVVGIAAFPKELDNGEVLVVATAVATQRESIDKIRQSIEEGFSDSTTTPSRFTLLCDW